MTIRYIRTLSPLAERALLRQTAKLEAEFGRASDSRKLRVTRSLNASLPAPSKPHPHLCPCGNVWNHTPAPEFGRCLYAGSTVPCPTCFEKENP
jgi:hypothetical protein